MATGSDRWSRDPEGGDPERVCACATGNCAISALVGPFHRKWCHQTSPRRDFLGWGARIHNRKLRNIRSNVTRRSSPGSHVIGSALGVFSRTSASYLSFSNPFTGYLPLSRHFISAFNNGFHLWCFRTCCVVVQVVYHVRVALLLYFQRSWRFLIPSSNFHVHSTF